MTCKRRPASGPLSILAFIARLVVVLALAVVPTPAEEMNEIVLDNGLRVVLRPVRANPVVCSAVLVRAGVAWEPEGMSGSSHFLEHLLFNGTETRTQEQLYADVDRIGAYNNATTRADHTLFMMLAPAEHLDRVFEIQSDMLLRSTLPEDKFEKEKGIVLEEMGRDSTNPAYLADQFFLSRAYAGSPYARPVLGTVDSIRGLERDDVLEYYRSRYRPEHMVLLLAGDFDPKQALERIRVHFGGGSGRTTPANSGDEIPRAQLAVAPEALVLHQRLDAGRTYLRAAFAAPGPGDPDAAAFGMLVELAARGDSSAVGQALKAGDEPKVFDYSLAHDNTGGVGVLQLSATLTGASSPQEVVRATIEAIRGAVAGGLVSAQDLRSRREAELTSQATLEEQVHYYAMFRAPRLLQSSAAELSAQAAETQAVDLESLARTAVRFTDQPSAVVTVSGPDEQDGATTKMTLLRARKAPRGETAAPAARSESLVLDNGLTLAVHTEPGASVFAAHVLVRNRSASEPSDHPGIADLLHRLLLKGSAARDAEGMEQLLESTGVTVKLFDDARVPYDDYQTRPEFSFVRVEARSERGLEALAILGEMLQAPRLPAEEIDRARARMADLAARRLESSGAVASQLFKDLVAAGHAYARPVGGTPESLVGVDRARLAEFHRSYMAPENLIVTIRSGASHEAILRRARQVFGGPGPAGAWVPEDSATDPAQSGARSPSVLAEPPPVIRESAMVVQAVGKTQSALRLGAVLDVAPEDLPALAAANLVLSDRLQMDLRETQGLAYRIGSSLSPLGERRWLLTVSMGTAPQNLRHAQSEIRRVVEELREGVVPADELERIVAARVGRLLMRRLTSVNQAYYDGLDLLYGTQTEGSLAFLEALKGVNPEQVREAARAYIDPRTWVTAVAE